MRKKFGFLIFGYFGAWGCPAVVGNLFSLFSKAHLCLGTCQRLQTREMPLFIPFQHSVL